MSSIDEAMASLSSAPQPGNSEPVAAVEEPKPADQAAAPAGETKNDSGTASENTAPPESAVDKSGQYDDVPKSKYAYIKLKQKLETNRAKTDKILEAIGKYSGITFNRETGNIDEYVKMLLDKADLEKAKQAIEEDPEVGKLWDELRERQAEEIFGNDESEMKLYRERVAPKRNALYKALKERDPSGAVLGYLKQSRRAPLLESIFLSNKGMATLNECLTDDDYQTKRNLEKLEERLEASVKAKAESTAQKKETVPQSTPSVNEGASKTKTSNGPSLAEVAKWF